MSDHIDRVVEALVRAVDDSAEYAGNLSYDDAYTLVRVLADADQLVTPEHDAAVAARAWDEGHTAGVRNASAEFDGPVQDNPYGRNGDPCICAACQPDYRFMRACATCGYKRCPGAADHRNTCTGSNEPGQPGSLYADPQTDRIEAGESDARA